MNSWVEGDIATFRNSSVRAARVDPPEPLQRRARHRLVPGHPPL